jgi:hypothetical protein
MRAAKIYTAKAEAAAEGSPYKRLRRRRASSSGRDPYASPAWRERWSTMEQEGAETAEYVPESLRELTDEEVAAEARAFWLDDLCDTRRGGSVISRRLSCCSASVQSAMS